MIAGLANYLPFLIYIGGSRGWSQGTRDPPPPRLPLLSCFEQKARVNTITLLVAEKGISRYQFPINFENEDVLPNLSFTVHKPTFKSSTA